MTGMTQTRRRGGITIGALMGGLLLFSAGRDVVYQHFTPDNRLNFESVARAVSRDLSSTGVAFEPSRINAALGHVQETGTFRYTVTGVHRAWLSPRDCVRVAFQPFYTGQSGRIDVCEDGHGGISADISTARPEDVNIERAAQYALERS